MNYKEKKLKQFEDCYTPMGGLKDGMKIKWIDYGAALDFLSSTIEEILKCMPPRLDPEENETSVGYGFRMGVNSCLEHFGNNLNERADKL